MAVAAEQARALGRYRPYPEYKDSGVPWLCEIPAHWNAKKLKHICTSSALYGANESADKYTNGGLRFLRTTDIRDDGSLVDDGAVYLPEESVREYRLADGDILLSRSGTLGRSFLYRLSEHGPCAYAGYLVRFVLQPEVFPRFVFYFTKAGAFLAWLESIAIHSTIGNVNGQKYANFVLAVPSPDEQRSIAAFLDREVGKIDALIGKKERLIALLQEKRTALITHAVTKGLDPNAPTKDSGVPWLGQIPAHWVVVRNKSIFDEIDVRSQDGEEELLTVSHITGVTRRSEKEVNMIRAESHVGYKCCWHGDLVINTMWAWMGALGISWEQGIASPSYNVYRPDFELILPEYYDFFVRTPAYICEINRYSKGVWSSRLRLYPDEFSMMLSLLPPLDEQQKIADYLRNLLVDVMKLTEKIATAISSLQEYRTALISAAVTGKIDVRDAV